MLLLLWNAPNTGTPPEPPIISSRPHWIGQFSRDYIPERYKRIEELEPVEPAQVEPAQETITLAQLQSATEYLKARELDKSTIETAPVAPIALELPADDMDDEMLLAWFAFMVRYKPDTKN
jgi:hypothetical protein